MHDREKSDDRVLPMKLPNNAQGGAAEAVEGRRPAKGNTAGETRPGLSAGHAHKSVQLLLVDWPQNRASAAVWRVVRALPSGCPAGIPRAHGVFGVRSSLSWKGEKLKLAVG